MEIAKIKKYKLPKESLLYVQEPQLMLFEDEFKKARTNNPCFFWEIK